MEFLKVVMVGDLRYTEQRGNGRTRRTDMFMPRYKSGLLAPQRRRPAGLDPVAPPAQQAVSPPRKNPPPIQQIVEFTSNLQDPKMAFVQSWRMRNSFGAPDVDLKRDMEGVEDSIKKRPDLAKENIGRLYRGNQPTGVAIGNGASGHIRDNAKQNHLGKNQVKNSPRVGNWGRSAFQNPSSNNVQNTQPYADEWAYSSWDDGVSEYDLEGRFEDEKYLPDVRVESKVARRISVPRGVVRGQYSPSSGAVKIERLNANGRVGLDTCFDDTGFGRQSANAYLSESRDFDTGELTALDRRHVKTPDVAGVGNISRREWCMLKANRSRYPSRAHSPSPQATFVYITPQTPQVTQVIRPPQTYGGAYDYNSQTWNPQPDPSREGGGCPPRAQYGRLVENPTGTYCAYRPVQSRASYRQHDGFAPYAEWNYGNEVVRRSEGRRDNLPSYKVSVPRYSDVKVPPVENMQLNRGRGFEQYGQGGYIGHENRAHEVYSAPGQNYGRFSQEGHGLGYGFGAQVEQGGGYRSRFFPEIRGVHAVDGGRGYNSVEARRDGIVSHTERLNIQRGNDGYGGGYAM